MAPTADHGRSRQIMVCSGDGRKTALTPTSLHKSMITDPRHRELLQQAIDAQTAVSDELQSALNARMTLPIVNSQDPITRNLWRDIKALEALISGAHDLLTDKASAVTLQGRSQP